MSDILPILTALATGLASVAIVAGYHLLLPAPEVAFVGASPMRAATSKLAAPRSNLIAAFVDVVRGWWRRKKTIEVMLALDDSVLHDIGLTRGALVSLRHSDRHPRNLYADMMARRLR